MENERNNDNVLGIVLAGGRGERLFPLTNDRAKPAVPVGGKYHMIDFVLSRVLCDALSRGTESTAASHDFGGDVIQTLLNKTKVFAYDFRENRIPITSRSEERSYWRDVGTLSAYYEVNMDQRSVAPSFNLYNQSWSIRTVAYDNPPAQFVFDENGRRGVSVNSIVGEGTIISGSLVRGSVIGRNVRINSYSLIEDSIIMDGVEIGRGCRIRRAIIDKHNAMPAGAEIETNFEQDREGYFVSDDDIVVVQRGSLSIAGFSRVRETPYPYLAEL